MKKLILAAGISAMAAMGAMAQQNDWLHIYNADKTINTGKIAEVDKVSFNPTQAVDSLFDTMTITRQGKTSTLEMSKIDSIVIGTNVPTMYIDIENGAEVVVKDNYLNAKIRIESYGAYDDFDEADVTIKGRGNSTWNMEKKPYRLKFKKKQELFEFSKAKSFAIIANMIDGTLTRNPFALKLGQLLGLEFTNSFVPVNLVINGTYRGAYMITEKIGIGGGSVDIDETKGILFELDENYDEPYKFKSNVFGLPVMVKDPDFDELAAEEGATMTAQQMFEKWKAEFQKLESTLSSYGTPSADFENQMDIETLVDYLLVYNVTGNREPHHPKSVYLYKEEGGKFKMGPIWDFDWAYTFDNHEGQGPYNKALFADYSSGTNFFKAMLRSEKVMKLYGERWAYFKSELYPQMLQFIDEYTKTIEVSAAQNGELWPTGYYSNKYQLKGTNQFAENIEALKTWLDNRVKWLDSAPNYGLW